MRLSEPVSDSHVAPATGAVPLFNFPPPYCSSISDPSSSSQVNPSSFHPLPPSSIPSSDPAPPAISAADGAPDPAPCSGGHSLAVLPHPPPSTVSPPPDPQNPRSAPPFTNSSSASPLSSSAGPVPDQDPPPPPPIPPSLPRTLLPGRSSSLSYAQAARGPRGPGFVRSHAADVESFARLPRTGANIICGSREGAPSFSFVSSDLPKVEEIYSNALIMKFLGGRPSLEASHKEILSWGIDKPFSIGPLSSRAFLLRFQDIKDLVRVLSRPSSILITFPYRVFRWHNQCHIKEDSCFAPVWITLPKLPLQCFIPEFLEAVANKIGRFLCFDKATATLARPSAARMCVELDLRKNPPPFIWVGLFEGLKQPVIYERMPKFCSQCLSQGHVALACPWGQRETLPIQADPRPELGPGRPPAVRRNASKRSSSKSHTNSNSVPFVSSSTPHPHTSTATITQSGPPISTVSTQPVVELRPSDSSQLTPSVCQYAPSHLSACSSGGNASTMSSNPSEGLVHQQQPHPQIDRQSDTGPNPAATISPQPPMNGCMNQSESADTHQELQFMPTQGALCPNPAVAPTTLPNKSILRKGRNRKKTVTFDLPGQSNLFANRDYWNAVTTQVALLEQQHPNLNAAPSSAAPVEGDTQPPPNPISHSQSELSSDESDCSSIAADSPPPSPHALNIHPQPVSYASEGEDCPTEQLSMLGHSTADQLEIRAQSSKRNKRHPDQPLKVQLRVRKDPHNP